MKLKLDEKGNVVVEDGKPVYVHDDGRETAYDVAGMVSKISGLNGEAKAHREAREAAEGRLKAFEGIEDPEAARAALSTVYSLEKGDLMKAGKVDEIKAEAQRAYEDKLKAVEATYKPIVEERDSLKQSLNKEIIGGSFSRSKFIGEKLAIPSDLVESKFGGAFSLEDGKIVAKDHSGNRIYSRSKPGEIAEFDEALETLVESYPHRDSILKGSGASGGGAGGAAGVVGGKRTMPRSQFDALDPAAKATAVREHTIVD